MWLDEHAAIGHRRLTVIDLDGGVQPMPVGHDGHTVAALTSSGEVLNHRELRAELAALGHTFRTKSDTEVVLRAFLEWGEDLAGRLYGMHAFAVWEPAARQLPLVRGLLGSPAVQTATTPGAGPGPAPSCSSNSTPCCGHRTCPWSCRPRPGGHRRPRTRHWGWSRAG
ncbi:hypothetical protein AQ490_26375 [Wenjunlia vitaminophila]|uniref:asparagine synthase (glutamine-hydrolyzing) n=1 Tax=Wenjunlia vitaminophila TaxID=76728 RepID=A0A0T6LPY9_WENVI|nr:hypothetical protein AQ490_26375 [Wenjunlia vitaminophila]